MERKMFTVELKGELLNYDFLIIRNLYMPIIGIKAVVLYQLFFDYYQMARNYNTFFEFNDLAKTAFSSEEELTHERKKLEAVGLITTFEKADNIHLIIHVHKPLNAWKFRKNLLLYRKVVKRIGEIIFERVEFSTKNKRFDKSEYKNVSVKYQDIFDVNHELASNSHDIEKQSTIEIPLTSIKSSYGAMSNLLPAQFIYYITGQKPSPSQILMLNYLTGLGFSARSLNIIINYSYLKNGKIVGNYIKAIAEDFLKKDLLDYRLIKEELEHASEMTKLKAKTVDNFITNDSHDWDDLFNSLGDV